MTPAKIALARSLMNLPNSCRRSDLVVGIGYGQISASALGTHWSRSHPWLPKRARFTMFIRICSELTEAAAPVGFARLSGVTTH
jgi:hypothetical protein